MRKTIAILVSAVFLSLVGCGDHPGPAANTPADLSRIAGWKGRAPNSPDTFRFVILSDRTGGHVPGLWAKAVAETNRLKPDFVMCVGDLVEGYIEDKEEISRQWNKFDAMTRKLDAPFFYCSGNHDMRPGACRKAYTRLHGVKGKSWYSFDYRGCHFVILDSTAMIDKDKALVEEQWTWAEKDFARAKDADHTFVFIHHPLFTKRERPLWNRLRAMLNAKKTTVFSGHWHWLSYSVEDGIPYFVLSATAARSGGAPAKPNRAKGLFQSYAHVVVSGGKPSISIIPLGEVLPHNFVDRAVLERLNALSGAATLGSVTRAGGEVALNLPNPIDADVACTLTWAGKGEWFAAGLPKAETLTIPAGKAATRTYRIKATGKDVPPPVLTVRYEIAVKGRTVDSSREFPLTVVSSLTARRVKDITIDGKLNDWTGVPAHATGTRERVKYNVEAWSGPADCSFTTRIGRDDKFLFLAVDVTDDAIVTGGDQPWKRDTVAVFWDPRPATQRVGRFTGPCRDIAISVPPPSQKLTVRTNPEDPAVANSIRAACLRRKGGYVVELAIPLAVVGERFKAAAGGKPPTTQEGGGEPGTLGMEVVIYDRDKAAPDAKTCYMVLSGLGRVHSNIAEYAVVTFR